MSRASFPVALFLPVFSLAVFSLAATADAESKIVQVQVRCDSEAAGYEAVNALDGNPRTLWHTAFGKVDPRPPHEIVVDLGARYPLKGLAYLPRAGGGNGTIRDYAIYVSDDPQEFREPIRQGVFGRVQSANSVPFRGEVSGRYVRLVALSEVNDRPWTSIAELEILSEGVQFRTQTSRRAATAPKRRANPGRRQGTDDGSLQGALDFARATLDYVQQSVPQGELATELAELERRAADAVADPAALINETRALRRRIILSHPALDFARLLINKRPPPAFSHQSDQYLGRHSGAADGLVILDNWKTDPRPTTILRHQLPQGSTLHPDLSFDAKRVLFSYCDHSEPKPEWRRFFLYEVALDGSGLRQITGTEDDPLEGFAGRETVMIEDWDPCYLPDGGIAFVSTRNQGGVRCHHGGRYCPTYTLYRCEFDGSQIRPMVYGEANEWDPSVLHDGRVIWTRWDYINRHDTIYQSLWTIHPDGTGTAHFYGNYTRNPCSIAEARAIPGSPKVVATATAHHSYTAGSIIVIDPRVGQEGETPLERVTPEIPFPETEGWGEQAAATPWPLNEQLFLVSLSTEKHARQGGRNSPNAYAIYLVDTLGGRELIYSDPEQSCFAPIPLVPRAQPTALPTSLPADAYAVDSPPDTGTFYVEDVYHSTQAIERGSIHQLRVLRMDPQTTIRVPDRSATLFETTKKVLGTVPVNEDGSVAFEAPAGQPLMFQLLDEHGMSVMSMRTFVYLHPGETVSCVGCHEPRNCTPARTPIPEHVRLQKLRPSPGPPSESGLSFASTVQPVLDRHCIDCHGLERTEGGLNLLGTMDTAPLALGSIRASSAYQALTSRPGLVSIAHRNKETAFSVPKDYYAHAGRLAHLLLEGDQDHVPLGGPRGVDPDGFQRIVDWLDVNAEFYGDYSWNKREWLGAEESGERELRAHIRATFGEELAGEPYAALVNVSEPSESRILMAPLSVGAGGWGQVASGWDTTSAPGYQRMRRLVLASIAPMPVEDVSGTCDRDPCECRSCWVREARAAYRAMVQARAAEK